MALFTGRGFGAAANAGFQSGFTGALQLLLQQKSEELQRELEGARAKQQKDQFDQQMAAEKERSDRDFLFAEKRAEKADLNAELDRLMRKNELSQASSDRTAERLLEENYRREQTDIEREKLGIEKSKADAAISKSREEDAPIDQSVAERMKALTGVDFTGTKKSDVNTLLSGITTGENVKASQAQMKNEAERTDIAKRDAEERKNLRKEEAVSSLLKTFAGERSAMAKEFSDAVQRTNQEKLAFIEEAYKNSLDDGERTRLRAMADAISNPEDRVAQMQAADDYATESVLRKIMDDELYGGMIEGAGLTETLRERLKSEFARKPKVEPKPVEKKTSEKYSNEDIRLLDQTGRIEISLLPESQRASAFPAIKKASDNRSGVYDLTIGDNTWSVKVPDPSAGDILESIFKGRSGGSFEGLFETSAGKKKIVEAYESLRASGRGKGWADTFEKAMNNEAFRSEIIRKAWVNWNNQ